jgi:hypothetical protein
MSRIVFYYKVPFHSLVFVREPKKIAAKQKEIKVDFMPVIHCRLMALHPSVSRKNLTRTHHSHHTHMERVIRKANIDAVFFIK